MPKRKGIRLKGYDYSQAGYYFITMCVKDGHEMLGRVVGDAPPRVPRIPTYSEDNPRAKSPHVQLSEYGTFIDAQIQKSSQIYPHVLIDKYIIMPNHVHLIIIIKDGTRRGASPTKSIIPQVMQSLKSITTKKFGFSIWQRSFHDHIIHNEADYRRIWQYIDENPANWTQDCYYTQQALSTL
ncbi:MAG: transposase [Oscillospiraceae bacterium]|nr:transposase [Oscillospiraceae bacterium]